MRFPEKQLPDFLREPRNALPFFVFVVALFAAVPTALFVNIDFLGGSGLRA